MLKNKYSGKMKIFWGCLVCFFIVGAVVWFSRRPKIEIYTVYHRSSPVLKNNIVIPIQAGRALNTEAGRSLRAQMIGDDTGDNISDKNDRYSELTALYWIWKNSRADYVGVMHYRRKLVLPKPMKYCNNYLCELGYTKDNIERLMQKYDVLVPHKQAFNYGRDLYEHYSINHYKQDFDVVLAYIRRKYPEMSSLIDARLRSRGYYPYNMFIAKKEIIDAYSAWVFDVLLSVDDKLNVDHSLYDHSWKPEKSFGYQKRAPGFISERLFDFWLEFHRDDYKIGEFPSAYREFAL